MTMLGAGLDLFLAVGALPRSVAFALTCIALVVLAFARCVTLCRTLPLSRLLCALTSVICLLALMRPFRLVLEVAVGTERQPQLSK
jgi:hypothetical protein